MKVGAVLWAIALLWLWPSDACLHSDVVLDNLLRAYNASIRPSYGRAQETLWLSADFQRMYKGANGADPSVIGVHMQLSTQWTDQRLVFNTPRLQPCSNWLMLPSGRVWQPRIVVSCASGGAHTAGSEHRLGTVLSSNGVLTQMLGVHTACPMDNGAIDWRYPFASVPVTWRLRSSDSDASSAILVWQRDRPPAVTAANYRLPDGGAAAQAANRQRRRRQQIASPLKRQPAQTDRRQTTNGGNATAAPAVAHKQAVDPSFSDTDLGVFRLRKFDWDYSLTRLAGVDVSELRLTAVLAVRRAPYVCYRFAPAIAATLVAGLASLWPMRREMAAVRASICIAMGVVLLALCMVHTAELPAAVVFTLFHMFLLGSGAFWLSAIAAALLERRADRSNTLKHSGGYGGNGNRDNFVSMYESIVFRRFCCAARYRLTFVIAYCLGYICFVIVYMMCCVLLVSR